MLLLPPTPVNVRVPPPVVLIVPLAVTEIPWQRPVAELVAPLAVAVSVPPELEKLALPDVTPTVRPAPAAPTP